MTVLEVMVEKWNALDAKLNRATPLSVITGRGSVQVENRKGVPQTYDALLVLQKVYNQEFAYYIGENGKVQQCSAKHFTGH